MLAGMLIPTSSGWSVEVEWTTGDGSTRIVESWRVVAMNGRPQSERAPVTFHGATWRGDHVEVGTDERPSVTTWPITKPKLRKPKRPTAGR